MKRHSINRIAGALMLGLFLYLGTGCAEHRYYHRNHHHSPAYYHRHHREVPAGVEVDIHN